MSEQERSIGQLVAEMSRDVSTLVRHEIALAKAEVKADVTQAAQGAVMLAAAALVAVLGVVMLCVAAAYGLVAAGLPTWAGFLVVFGVLVLVAGVLALVGRSRLNSIVPPERTVKTSKDTVAVLKGDADGPSVGAR